MVVSAQPTITMMLVAWIHFFIPKVDTGDPANMEPRAEPAAHTEVISPFHRSLFSHLNIPSKSLYI